MEIFTLIHPLIMVFLLMLLDLHSCMGVFMHKALS